jgi:hypothetical protein
MKIHFIATILILTLNSCGKVVSKIELKSQKEKIQILVKN